MRAGRVSASSAHVLYRNGRGELYVDGVQTAGVSSSGEALPSWRQFKLSGLRSLVALEEGFEVEELYNPSSSRYSAGLIVGFF